MLGDIIISFYIVSAVGLVSIGVRRFCMRGEELGLLRSFAPLFQFYGVAAAGILIALSLGVSFTSKSLLAVAAAHAAGVLAGIMRARRGRKWAGRLVVSLSTFMLVVAVCFSALIRSTYYFLTHRDSILVIRDHGVCDRLERDGYIVSGRTEEGICRLEHVSVWFGSEESLMNEITTADGRWLHVNKELSVIR